MLGAALAVVFAATNGFVLLGVSAASAKAPASDISMTLTQYVEGVHSTAPIFAGTEVVYELAIANTSSSPTSAFTIDFPLTRDADYDPGSESCGGVPNCTFDYVTGVHIDLDFDVTSLPVGGSGTLSVGVTPAVGAQFQPITEVAHLLGDGCTSSVCASNKVSNRVFPRPVILVGYPNDGLPVPPNGTIVYDITAKNPTLLKPQSNVVVTDDIPTGTSYVAGSASCLKAPGCTASEANNVVTYTYQVIPPRPGNLYKVTFSVVADISTGTIVDTASWMGDLCSIGSCFTAPTSVIVSPTAATGVAVTKSASPSPVSPGGKLTYSLSVTNPTVTAQTSLVITDDAPTGTTYDTKSAKCQRLPGCTASESGGVVTFSIPSVAPGAVGDVTFSVTVGSSATGTVSNIAQWTGGGCTSATCSTNDVITPIGPVTTVYTAPTTTTTTKPPATKPAATKSSSTPLAYTGAGPGLHELLLIGLGLTGLGLLALGAIAIFRPGAPWDILLFGRRKR